MNEYNTRDERVAAETDFDKLPASDVEIAPDASMVYSLRVKGAELDEIKAAADAAGQTVSAYIREAAIARARAHGDNINDLTAQLAKTVAQLRHELTDSAA